MSKLEDDNKRLDDQNNDLIDKIEQLKKKCSDEVEELKRKYEAIFKETIDVQVKEIVSNLENENNALQKQIEEYQEHLKNMGDHIGEKDLHLENWKEKVFKIEKQRINELNEFKNHLENLKQLHFNTNSVEFDAERIAYENAILHLKNKIRDAELELQNSFNEINQLKQINAQKSKEINELKQKVKNFESGNKSDTNKFIKENDTLKRENAV